MTIRRLSVTLRWGWVTFLASACAHTWNAHEFRSVDDIIRSAAILEGHSVSVRGYLRFGDESKNLWSNRDAYLAVRSRYVAPTDPKWNRCITLYDLDGWRAKLRSSNDRYVVIAGVLRRYPTLPGEINFDSCSDLGVSIQSVELAPR